MTRRPFLLTAAFLSLTAVQLQQTETRPVWGRIIWEQNAPEPWRLVSAFKHDRVPYVRTGRRVWMDGFQRWSCDSWAAEETSDAPFKLEWQRKSNTDVYREVEWGNKSSVYCFQINLNCKDNLKTGRGRTIPEGTPWPRIVFQHVPPDPLQSSWIWTLKLIDGAVGLCWGAGWPSEKEILTCFIDQCSLRDKQRMWVCRAGPGPVRHK